MNSFCGNVDHRTRIRNSWLPRAKPLGIGVTFYVARSPHCNDGAVADEQRQHGDLVILPLHETYDKLTVKTHALLLHAAALEPKVDLLLKVDDDIYIDPHRFAGRVAQLHREGLVARGVYGGFFHNATIVLRDPANKWFDGEYPMAHYPPYASGAAYFLSRPALEYLARAGREGSLVTRWHNEDASVGSWLSRTPREKDGPVDNSSWAELLTNIFSAQNYHITSSTAHARTRAQSKTLRTLKCMHTVLIQRTRK